MRHFKQRCESCGSEDVARLQWVNVNTEEVYDADPGIYTEWCFGECEDQTNIISYEDSQDKDE